MKGLRQTILRFLIAIGSTATPCAFAEANFEPPTMEFKLDYGPSTYKSKLVESNDTSYTMRYSVGIYAGESKSLVFLINSDSNTTAFELNTSSIASAWQETFILYRMTYLYLGAIISSVTMTAKGADSTDLFDLVGTGYGGAAGTQIEFGRGGVFKIDIASATISKVSEVNQTDVTFGARTDIDIGCTYDLSRRMFDLMFGYRQRTLSIKTTESFAESLSTTYVGLATSLDF